MTIRLEIQWDQPKDDDLHVECCVVPESDDGSMGGELNVEAKGTNFDEGCVVYSIDNSDVGKCYLLSFNIEIALEEDYLCLLEVRERLEVIAEAPGLRLNYGQWANGKNPRCSLQLVALRSGKGHTVVLKIDTLFVDVTPYHEQVHGSRFDSDRPDGCKIRILQYSGDKGPPIWNVLVPPALERATTERVSAMLFFAPERPFYEDIDDFDTLQLMRYLMPGWWGEYTFWAVKYNDVWIRNGLVFCRYARQIHTSGKPVLFVMPENNDGEFGAARDRPIESLRHIIVALWADGHLKDHEREAEDVVGRVGFAGYSYGGPFAVKSWSENHERVYELYLFDPNFTKNEDDRYSSYGLDEDGFHELMDSLGNWAGSAPHKKGGEGTKKLRMIGGMNLYRMLRNRGRLKAEVSDSPAIGLVTADSTIWPGSNTFWERSEVFRVFTMRDEFDELSLGNPDDEQPAPPSELSRVTGIYLYHDDPTPKDTHIRLIAKLPDGTWTEPCKKFRGSHSEASLSINTQIGMMNGCYDGEQWLQPLPLHVQSEKEFKEICKNIKTEVGWIRHEWVVIGGQGDDNPTTIHRGYLLLCLDSSGF